jgi:hypothetical protein
MEFCLLYLCLTPLKEIRFECPTVRTHPEQESISDCRTEKTLEERNNGIINKPNVCDSLNTAYMTTTQEAEYWQKFKCPLG